MKIILSKTTKEDLETLFVFQTNPKGIQMAAFTSEDPSDKKAYLEKWSKIVENPEIKMQTIRIENNIVGSVIHFDMMGETNVSYWIDQPFWGQGIASEALKTFVKDSTKRPLYAQVAFDNYGSQKVLEKCGFKVIATEKGFANARQQEIEEFIYKL
jgi:RimJ/RimL family protein N-acetyltransferase